MGLTLPVGDLLDALAAPTPTPASGTGAALTGAIAAALAELTAGVSKDGQSAATARSLRARLLALADEDAVAYGAFVRTRSEDDRNRTIDVPLAIAEAAAEVRALATDLVPRATPSATGDAEAAVELAGASARVGARLVEINLEGSTDERLERARVAAAR